MTSLPNLTVLRSRAIITVGGADWRGFLQGLLTQDVEAIQPGEARFAGLLTPQGRLIYDLFVIGTDAGCLIDCATEHRDALIGRLSLYRLRAKVEITPSDMAVQALWHTATPAGWCVDPRLETLGARGYGAPTPVDVTSCDETAYEAYRFAQGVPSPDDWGVEKTYPIEANFDLLNGIDFRKGCFVGQETTSRMKRRGIIKTRMVPVAFDGPAPEAGAELLAGTLRAGEVLSAGQGGAMASLRLDRLGSGPLTLVDGREWHPMWPAWLERQGDDASSN